MVLIYLIDLEVVRETVVLVDLAGVEACIENSVIENHFFPGLKRDFSENHFLMLFLYIMQRTIEIVPDLNHLF